MRAVTYSEFGGPEVLSVTDVEEPHAGPGQVRVKVRAAGVNPIDWKIRGGLVGGDPPSEPRIPGSDVSGVVDEVGDGVSDVSVGDAVFGNTVGGATAEYAVVDPFFAKPDALSFEEAAGYPVVVETAARVLDLLGVGDGDTLLINGAAGGVGTAAVQLARARGARVIGLASERNHDFLRELGAEPTTYGEGFPDRVRELAPAGVTYAFDTAGSGVLPELIDLAGGAANVVSIADFKNAPALGVRLTAGQPGDPRAWYALGEAADLAAEGRFSLPVERAYPFSEAAEAHRVSQEGHVRGKLVIVPE
jgi:NADPH:quinone reductase-like Zn-dependent oxidoreductase